MRSTLTLRRLAVVLCLPVAMQASAQLQTLQVARQHGAPVSEPCGFDHFHRDLMLNDLVYRQRNDLVDDIARNAGPFVRSLSTYKVPVVVHVMDAGGPTSAMSDDQVRNAIRVMNERFRKVAGTPGAGSGVDVGMEFALAARDPNGNCTNGINRVDMSTNGTYVASGVSLGGPGIPDSDLKSLAVWDRTRYLNIYVVNEIDGNNGTFNGVQGYAVFAGGHAASYDGLVILANQMRDPANTTLTHEMGHMFNAYHTFEGDAGGSACPPNTSCTTMGDEVCDTPPHIRSTFNCNVAGTNACDGNSSNALFARNYMDYSSSACQNMFTAGQATRMVTALTVLRSSYLAVNGNLALVPPGNPLMDIAASRNFICGTGQPVTLYTFSRCIPNTYLPDSEFPNQGFSWTFTNGVNTYTSTLQNPTFTPASGGAYNATVTITTPLGTFTRTENGIVVVVTTSAAVACIPGTQNAPANYGVTVSRVRFNTIDRGTSPSENGGYTDLTCTHNTVVAHNATYPLTVHVNGNGTFSGVFNAYIDFNNNGNFTDAGELVATGSSLNPGGVVNANVTIPNTAVLNTPLRLRVYGEADNLAVPTEITCSIPLLVADVEDYGVLVSSSLAAVSIAAAPGATVANGTNVTFTATPTNGGTTPTYAWFRNNVQVGTGSTYASNTFVTGDKVRCEMTSNLAGVVGSPAVSNEVTMTVTGPPISDFKADKVQLCTGGTVQFTDISLRAPTSWSWSFPGGTPSSSTVQNPVVTYATAGTYAVTLTASNALGTGTVLTRTAYITVFAAPPATCALTRTNPPTGDVGIFNVTLNTLNNSTPYFDAPLVDLTCSKGTVLLPNTTYTIQVSVGMLNIQWVRAYIDYNRDGDFVDAGELIFAPPIGTGVRQGTFTTPTAPTIGALMRMRVITDFAGNGGATPGPCASPLGFGQAEEYGVVFAQLDCQGVVNGPALPGTACNDNNACTTADTWNASCQCVGTASPDTDGDGVCDALDNCPTVPGQVGSACNDGNPATINDVLNASCACVGVPANDAVCNAIALAVGTNGPFSNVGATAQAGEPTPPLGACETQGAWCTGGGVADNTVWFTFVAPPSGRVSLNFGTTQNWDSRIAVWSAANCSAITSGGATLLAANDDITNGPPYHAAILPLCVTPGTTYFVQVDGYSTITNGAFQLVLVQEPGAVGASLAAPLAVCTGTAGSVTFTGTAGATVTYTVNGGAPQNGVLAGGTLVVPTGNLTAPAVYDLVSVTNGTCTQTYPAQDVTDLVTVAVQFPPAVSGVGATPQAVCAGGTAQLGATVLTGASYCTSGLYFDGCGFGDIITQVQFANLSSNTGCDGPGATGYSLFTTPQANVVAGQTYAFSMSTGPVYDQGGAAWVDWDQDGTFEQSELIVAGYTGQVGASYTNASYTVPANAFNGRTRLRVRCTYGASPIGNPCGVADYGEVEDYFVNVTGGVDAYTYAWTPAGSLVNPSVLQPTTTALTAATTFNLTVATSAGCSSTGTTTVNVTTVPVINAVTATPATVCAGASSQLAVAVAGITPYCAASQTNGTCTMDEHITNVTFGSIVSNSGCSLPAGYEDRTNLTNAVTAGATGLPLSVTFGPFFSGDQLRVWIDWDQDGQFTGPGEEYNPGAIAGTSGSPVTTNLLVNVPATARNGNTRMRVRLAFTGGIPPCGATQFGETEDYTIIVSGGIAPIIYAWTPANLLNNPSVASPTAPSVPGTTTFNVTVDNQGCTATGSVTVNLDVTDTDGDGVPNCTDNCPLVPGQIGSACNDGNANTINDVLDGSCTCVGTPAIVAVQASVVLEGAYVLADGLMRDNLRTLGTFPLSQPYAGAPWNHAGTETVSPAVLAVTGPNAVVDWVLVDVRIASAPFTILQTKAGLLQRDGDIVAPDGITPLLFNQVNGTYNVSVRHRNHLAIMTSPAVTLSGAGSVVDLRVASTPTFGTDARKNIGGAFPVLAMWAGDVTGNGQLKYTGGSNDRDPILTRIGGSLPTNTVSGYWPEDCTLDGSVKYTGSGNDRDVILLNIGGTVPTAIRNAQLP